MNHTDNIAYWQALPLACLSVIYCHIVNPSTKRLRDTVRHGKILPATTLSKWWHGWRIKHPQAATTQRQSALISRNFGHCAGALSSFGAWVGSQRKRPGCALSVGRCFAATRSASVKYTEVFPMIYTFLIQRSRTCRVVELSRIRTISTFGQNEAQARAALAGLPLVFMSRTPSNKGVAV